ncbi:hypothetical protein IFM60648_05798, partial [Aspergillus lentulus]
RGARGRGGQRVGRGGYLPAGVQAARPVRFGRELRRAPVEELTAEERVNEGQALEATMRELIGTFRRLAARRDRLRGQVNTPNPVEGEGVFPAIEGGHVDAGQVEGEEGEEGEEGGEDQGEGQAQGGDHEDAEMGDGDPDNYENFLDNYVEYDL